MVKRSDLLVFIENQTVLPFTTFYIVSIRKHGSENVT